MSRSLPMLSLLLVTGCAQSGEFPSLSPRAIEREAPGQAPSTPAQTGADAQLLSRLAAIVEGGEAGHRAFLAELASTAPTIQKGSAANPGGEAWVAAQQAYSRLDAARSPLLSALADLDALRREQADKPNPGNHAALDRAAQRLSALNAEEGSTLAELAAKLG